MPSVKTTMMPVDKQKLFLILKQRNIKKSEASVKIGYTENYLSNIGNDENPTISRVAVNSLKLLYGINYEEYKPMPKEKPKPAVEQQPKTSWLSERLAQIERKLPTSKDLSDIIYSAVYDALKKALSE